MQNRSTTERTGSMVMILAIVAAVLWSGAALAVPAAVPYIGFLSDDQGGYDGTVSITVEMFDQADGGASLWGPVEFTDVIVESGVFTVVLGAPSGPELDTLVLPAEGAWLEFTIDGTLLEPRQEMLSVPYALWSESADSCGEADSLGDSGCDDGQVIKWVSGSGVWVCANDLGGGGAEYTAGAGLNLAGTEFSVVAATIEGWATGVCYDTTAELVAALPVWDQDASDDLTSLTAGTGISVSGSGNSRTITNTGDTNAGDDLTTATVFAGDAGGAWDALTLGIGVVTDGHVSDVGWGKLTGVPSELGDGDDDTTYTAGTGLLLAGTEFSVVSATIEGWASDVCYDTPQELSGTLAIWDQDVTDDLTLGDLADVASSGSYDDLADQPDLSIYLHADGSIGLLGDLDIASHRLLNIAVDASVQSPSGPVAGQLWWDGDGDILRVWTGMEWLGLGSGAGSLPSDGLFAVSNGTLTNELSAEYAASVVPSGIGVSVDIEVEIVDAGSIAALEFSFSLSHPYCPDLSVKLLPPGDDDGIVVAAAGEITGTEFSGTFGIADALPSGDTLQSLLGTEQSGVWLLRVTDTVQNGNEGDGEVLSFELSTSYLASGQVQVNADQTVSGAVSADSMVVDGVDVGAKLAALESKIWCLESCDPAKLGDCQDRDCDGILQTCTESGPLPDGAACQGGAGVCLDAECCVPLSCVLLDAMCGEASDGCGGFLNCGLCQDPEAVCFENQCCVPATCESLVKECGDWSDVCGGMTGECGPCVNGYACGETGLCDGSWVGFDCGGVTCPDLPGYTVTCNAKTHCEYANDDAGGWKAWDVWIYIAPGSFQMGSTGEGGGSDETPVHGVTIGYGYFISKYEIVVEEYEACMADSGTCSAPSTVDWDGNGWGTNSTSNHGSDHPQNGLTWQQSKEFCAWVTPGGRLPSESEWEYAATGPIHLTYPWGNAPAPTCSNNTAVFNEAGGTVGYGCSQGGTWSVGSKSAGASWCGALDMSGNLWEWCEDWWHGDYNGAPGDGSAWVVPSGSNRVLRGGSFSYEAVNMRAAKRNNSTPSTRIASLGARCLRPLP